MPHASDKLEAPTLQRWNSFKYPRGGSSLLFFLLDYVVFAARDCIA